MQYHHLTLSGSLTIGSGDIALRKQVEYALERGHHILVVDLSKVTYMDSATVGQLAHSYKAVLERGGRIALIGLRPKVRKLLQIMSFLEIFPVFDSLEDAVQIMEMRIQKERNASLECDKVAV